MSIIVSIIILLLAGYAVLIETYRKWFLKIPLFTPKAEIENSIHFSVIIPARNEAGSIAACLESILKQDYPNHLFEIIVIDDHSTDNTVSIVEGLVEKYANLQLLQLHKIIDLPVVNSYKKKAIEIAIRYAKGNYIVTTDADCNVRPLWLSNYASFILQKPSVFVAAPVKFSNSGTFLSIFQCLDFLSLQGVSAASVHNRFHTMCNGANIAYSKKTFLEVGGFSGIDAIASGDDMLLMHKIFVKEPTGVNFLFSKESIVETPPMATWKEFFNQRIRWASKADKFDDKRIFWVLVLVYGLNFSLFILPVLAFWNIHALGIWLLLVIAKTIIELRFMFPVARFFGDEKLLWWFPIMQPFHIAYTVIAGWLGKFGTYTWKGRVVK